MTVAVWMAGLLLPVPFAVSAQEAPAAANAPASDAIGPPQLQNFSLPGRVVRPAEQPPQPTAPVAKQAAREQQPETSAPPVREAAKTAVIEKTRAAPRARQPQPQPQVASSMAPPQPPPEVAMRPAPTPATVPTAAFPADRGLSSAPVAPQRGLPPWPWLLAAFAVAAGAFVLLRRSGRRPAFAGAPRQDEFTTPQPAPPPPAPRPAPAPPAVRPAEQPSVPPLGVVSTGLRPWAELGVQPLRCIVADDLVTIELELELFNSGSAPAREVLVEAVVINAGPTQEQEIAAFFARPAGQGERIEAIDPLKRIAFATQVVTARERVRAIEMGGRRLFVPLIAFNVLYRWGSKTGQTSAAYLLGRDSKTDKLAPFRLDLGPRLFRGLGARPLPAGVRS